MIIMNFHHTPHFMDKFLPIVMCFGGLTGRVSVVKVNVKFSITKTIFLTNFIEKRNQKKRDFSF